MGETTAIEWATSTFNPWSGCTKVSPACANCYAESMCDRFDHLGGWGPGAERKRTSAANWRKPRAWDAKAERVARWLSEHPDDVEAYEAETGESVVPPDRPRVFCASLADWLDPEVPAEWLADLLALIAETPHLDWLLLTKRPGLWRERMQDIARLGTNRFLTDGERLARDWILGKAPPNVWAGATVENQEWADKRIPELLKIPARIRFLSCEPLLGPMDLWSARFSLPECGTGSAFNWGKGVHWVIAGGESGPKARASDPAWFRSLRDQCQAAGVPFLFKQWGAWAPGNSEDYGAPTTSWHTLKGGGRMAKVGKKAAGKELDGREWLQLPGPVTA